MLLAHFGEIVLNPLARNFLITPIFLLRKLHTLFHLCSQHIRVHEYFKFVQRLFVRQETYIPA